MFPQKLFSCMTLSGSQAQDPTFLPIGFAINQAKFLPFLMAKEIVMASAAFALAFCKMEKVGGSVHSSLILLA
jgi:hypothetical protein